MSAVTKALKKHPAMNATVDDFVDEILLHGPVHLGCAVDTENGLMVPVIKGADSLSPIQLSDETTRLAKACRDRSIAREELSGGTFTISNVGSFVLRLDSWCWPFKGRLQKRCVHAGLVLPLSLSCDHPLNARFLRTELLENPEVDPIEI